MDTTQAAEDMDWAIRDMNAAAQYMGDYRNRPEDERRYRAQYEAAQRRYIAAARRVNQANH